MARLSPGTSTPYTKGLNGMDMSEKEHWLINDAIVHHRRTGAPEKAAAIKRHLAAGEMPPAVLLSMTGVQPKKPVKELEDLQPPPLTGKGSSTKAWVEFAATVSDQYERDVLLDLGKQGIVEVLVKDGVLPAEEYT